jgi:hypothetical protein
LGLALSEGLGSSVDALPCACHRTRAEPLVRRCCRTADSVWIDWGSRRPSLATVWPELYPELAAGPMALRMVEQKD